MTANTPTIVFVHGAWADASGFSDAGRQRFMAERGNARIEGWRPRTRPWCRSQRP